MKANWNFLGGRGLQNKNPSVGEYSFFSKEIDNLRHTVHVGTVRG